MTFALIYHVNLDLALHEALREYDALSDTDNIPLARYLLNGKNVQQKSDHMPIPGQFGATTQKFDPLAQGGNSLPVGFRIYIKSKMNDSQLRAITASASEYGA